MTADIALERWSQSAKTALVGYGLSDAVVTPLSVRENAVFLVATSAGQTRVLRLCRPGYRSIEELRSEVAWVDALHRDHIVEVPAVYPNDDGELVHTFRQGESLHAAVLSEFVPGAEPAADAPAEVFTALGRLSANLHTHGDTWNRPIGWTRPVWDIDAIIGPGARAGDWRESRHLVAETTALFTRVELDVRARLTGSDSAALTTALVHADLHPGNLLVRDGTLTLIDFDDCGTSWPLWDMACAVVNKALDPGLAVHWLSGYLSARDLSRADLDTAGPLIMLRTIMIIGWLETHRHAIPDEEAALLVQAAADLARRYLAGGLID